MNLLKVSALILGSITVASSSMAAPQASHNFYGCPHELTKDECYMTDEFGEYGYVVSARCSTNDWYMSQNDQVVTLDQHGQLEVPSWTVVPTIRDNQDKKFTCSYDLTTRNSDVAAPITMEFTRDFGDLVKNGASCSTKTVAGVPGVYCKNVK